MTADEPRLCVVCRRRELPTDVRQTCGGCVTRVRTHIEDIPKLWTLLPLELEGRIGAAATSGGGGDPHPIPMSELLSLMGPGSDGTSDAQADDAPSVTWSLWRWVDDWRAYGVREPQGTHSAVRVRDFQTLSGRPRVIGSGDANKAAETLTANLGTMAQRHPAFADFAYEMRALRARLLRALRLIDDPLRMNVDCFDCGSPLVRDYRPPSLCPHGPAHHTPACDQGGLRDECRCVGCGRVYTPAAYRLALVASAQAECERLHGEDCWGARGCRLKAAA